MSLITHNSKKPVKSTINTLKHFGLLFSASPCCGSQLTVHCLYATAYPIKNGTITKVSMNPGQMEYMQHCAL